MAQPPAPRSSADSPPPSALRPGPIVRTGPADELPLPRGALLRHAAVLGLLGEYLLRGGVGVNVGLWVAALLVSTIVFARREGARLAPGALGLAFLPVAALAVRDGRGLEALLLAASAAGWVLLLLGTRHRRSRRPRDRRSRSPRARDLAGATAASLGGAAVGAVPIVASLRAAPPVGSGGARRMVGGVALAAPLLIVFTMLFRSADPIFDAEVGRVLRVLAEIEPARTLTALALAWVSAGSLREVFLTRKPPRVGLPIVRSAPTSEILIALLLVDALFVAFALTQLAYWFGGADVVASTTGLTMAEYARRGFFELVAVAALALPLVLAADHVLLRAPRERRRTFRILARTLLGLLGVVLVSAAYRMALYVESYGLTLLRLYTFAAMIWLGVAAAAVAARVLRGRRRPLVRPLAAAALVEVLALTAASPDAVIARVNVARHLDASGPRSVALDTGYLSTLSADATPTLLASLGRLDGPERCALAAALEDRRPPARGARTDDWRSWSVGRWRSRTLLEGSRSRLERILEGCPATARETTAVRGGDVSPEAPG